MRTIEVSLAPQLAAQGFRPEHFTFKVLWTIAFNCGVTVDRVVAVLEGRSMASALPIFIQAAKVVPVEARMALGRAA